MPSHQTNPQGLRPAGRISVTYWSNKALAASLGVGLRAWAAAGGLLLAMATLNACSEDKPRGRNSELLADQPEAATPEAPTIAAETSVSAAAAAPIGPLTGAGRRYRVAVGMAYFFAQPEQSPPTGHYLRRGDAFYGEGERNGFVKTGFVNPDGTRGTGWLKTQELGRLPDNAAPNAGRSSKPAPPLPAAAPAAYDDEPTATPEPVARPGGAAGGADSGATTAAVQVAKSYFFDSPDLTTPRKAHCVRGDKVRLGESRGAAVYVTFTNWEKVTTTGWMRADALR